MRRLRRLDLADLAPPPHDDNPIGVFDHLLHVVGYEDYGVAVVAQPLDEAHHLPEFADAERRRRFIQNDDLAREGRRAGYRNRLSLAAGHEAYMCVEARQTRPGAGR